LRKESDFIERKIHKSTGYCNNNRRFLHKYYLLIKLFELGDSKLLKRTVSGIILTLLLISMVTLAIDVQQVTSCPFESMVTGSNSIQRRITISFPIPQIEQKDGYDWLKIENCSYFTRPGHPMLPVRSLTVKLSEKSSVTNVRVDVTEALMHGIFSILPAPTPIVVGSQTPVNVSEDPMIYKSNTLFPKEWYVYREANGLDAETSKRIKYLILNLFPLRFLPTENKVIRAEKVDVTITYTESPEPLTPLGELKNMIITSPTLEEYAIELAEWKNDTGISSKVLNTTWIYSHYDGVDNPEKIRNCITDFAATYGVLYVTIFGDADQVPVRQAYVPDGHETYTPTDLYYADLDGTWDDNGDGLYADQRHDWVDGIPDVYVGRIPPSLAYYAQTAVDKIKGYKQQFDASESWTGRIVLAAGTCSGDGFTNLDENGTAVLKEYVSNIVSDKDIVKLYELAGNLSTASMTSEIDNGALFVNFAGHGDPGTGLVAGGWLFYWVIPGLIWNGFGITDVQSLTNGFKLPVVTTMSCSTARFDDTDCIGEWFVLEPDGGSIAYFGATRIAYCSVDEGSPYGLMGEIDRRIYESYYEGFTKLGQMWGQPITKYVQSHIWNYQTAWVYDVKTFMEFVLLGDPTLRIYNPDYPETLNVPEDYSTIQTAINAAYDGDTILVSAETYYESIVVNKTVSLVGEGRDDTVVDAESTGTVIRVAANNVNINGFTIQNSGTDYPNCGIIVDEWVTGTNISYNIIAHNYYGIRLENSNSSTIAGNNITNNREGIVLLWSSDFNEISENDVTGNNYGISVYASSNNSIFGNNIAANSYQGIYTEGASYNRISGNNITDNGSGILFEYSDYNMLSGNNVTDNGSGITLWGSSNNKLRSNCMANNTRNFGVHQSYIYPGLSEFVHDVDTSNTVDEKPIYYLVHMQDFTVPLDAGYVALVNCTRMTIQNLNLTNNGEGILLAFTTESMIHGNNITDSGCGIAVLGWSCSNNTIFGNSIAKCGSGIASSDSTNNRIFGNALTNNSIGVYVAEGSSNTDVVENNMIENDRGISLLWCSGVNISENIITENNLGIAVEWYCFDINITGNNIIRNGCGVWINVESSNGDHKIYHNNFVNNTYQAIADEDSSSVTVWDDGYPSGGNYWSDYPDRYPLVGDDCHGEDQLVPGGDGVWDSPCELEWNQDRYPLVEPWSPQKLEGDVNRDNIVNVKDLTIVSLSYGSFCTEPDYDRKADLNYDCVVEMKDLSTVARNLLKTYP
jgi:parallel beta-helix repeat protein